MKKISTRFKNLYIFKNKRFDDNRGYLREIFLEKKIKKKLKFTIVSSSKKNVIRGMHFQVNSPQDKLISVVIPAHNEESYLESTINSLLNQTYQNFEVIIVLNSCTDKSLDIVNNIKKNSIRYPLHILFFKIILKTCLDHI